MLLYKIIFIVAFILPISALKANPLDKQLYIVGSSTVYPFVTIASERFARITKYSTPIVESTGTGWGLKLYCEEKAGEYKIDIVMASRTISDQELKTCSQNGKKDLLEITLGYDALVLANANSSEPIYFTEEILLKALLSYLPNDDNTLVPNKNKLWSDIDPKLPKNKIIIYSPPASSGSYHSFTEFIKHACLKNQKFKNNNHSMTREAACSQLREDVIVQTSSNDNIIVSKLTQNPDHFGVISFAFLEENKNLVKANAFNGYTPTYDSIKNDYYKIRRPIYLYTQKQILNTLEMALFINEILSKNSLGRLGYLTLSGLINNKASYQEHQKVLSYSDKTISLSKQSKTTE